MPNFRLIVCLVVSALAECGCQNLRQGPASAYFSCFDQAPSGVPFLDRKISVSYSGFKVAEVVRRIREVNDLPISYIETAPAEAGSLKLEGISVRAWLRALVDARPGYVCRIVGGHVMVYPDLPDFEQVVRAVSLVRMHRLVAVRRYLEYPRRQTLHFRDIEVVAGGVIESPVFEECVSLARDATLIVHLAQLLGKDRSIYLDIQQAPTGGLVLGMGNVDNRAMRSAHPREPLSPSDCDEL
jgi:hypothetical protein